MDIRCKICLEPYALDELHYLENGMTFEQASQAFRERGCSGIDLTHNMGSRGMTEQEHEQFKARQEIVNAIQEMLGDDIDGIASTLDDLEYLGGF